MLAIISGPHCRAPVHSSQALGEKAQIFRTVHARARALAEFGRRDQIVLAGLQPFEQPVGALGLFGGALDHAAHQEELRIVAAVLFGIDGLHVDTPVSTKFCRPPARVTSPAKRNFAHQLGDFAPGSTDVIVDLCLDAFGMALFDDREHRLMGLRDVDAGSSYSRPIRPIVMRSSEARSSNSRNRRLLPAISQIMR